MSLYLPNTKVADGQIEKVGDGSGYKRTQGGLLLDLQLLLNSLFEDNTVNELTGTGGGTLWLRITLKGKRMSR